MAGQTGPQPASPASLSPPPTQQQHTPPPPPPAAKQAFVMDRDMIATMCGSATSGMLARLPCHPLDTAKARLQVAVSALPNERTVFGMLKSTVRTEGIRGLYRGLGVAFFGSAPAACLYFSAYESSKRLLEPLGPKPLAHFASGLVAETLSCVLWVPIDVVKERLQVQRPSPNPTYRGNWHAIRTIAHKEGLRGVYKGYGATVVSFGPFSALFFAFHEEFKRLGAPSLGEQSLTLSLLSGALAGGAASFLTNPLDVAKVRIQVQRGFPTADLGYYYKGFLHAFPDIIRKEGVAGLFKGVSARVLFHAPATAISIALFEQCKLAYLRIL